VDTAKLLTIFALGALELWAAIPAGLALKANPVLVGVVAAAGAMLGVLVVVLLGERVRQWLAVRQRRGSATGSHGLIRRIWDRYGVIGLGLLAPLLTGAPIGAALGLALGAPSGRLLFWMLTGIALWSTVLTLVGVLGIAGYEAAVH
jgi:membrane protein YqaA with SNARE-associated domain